MAVMASRSEKRYIEPTARGVSVLFLYYRPRVQRRRPCLAACIHTRPALTLLEYVVVCTKTITFDRRTDGQWHVQFNHGERQAWQRGEEE